LRLTRPIKNRATASALNLSTASMIDVVFLLLIFFLVTTSFRTPTQSVVTPILSRTVSQSDISDVEIEQVTLAIGDEAGKVTYEMGGVKTTEVSEIRELLNNLKPNSAQIIVQVNDGIPFQSAISLITLCKNCGHESASWFSNHGN